MTDEEIIELENVYITMEDGIRLAARIWLPAVAKTSKVPAIFEYLPYRKRDKTAERDEINHRYFAKHGYASIRVDIRGNGESDGLMEDEYLQSELDDGVNVITWIADQTWCDGNVGMIGISWGGFNGLQIAQLNPKALKAVISVCSTDDRYTDDIHFSGGCLLTDNLTWSAQMMSYSCLPPDPALREDWQDVWRNRLENLPFLADNWTRHLNNDSFWKHGSVCYDYEKINAAVFAVGGWHDLYTNTISRLLSNLKSPCLGLIGPWVHRYPHLAHPKPTMDFLAEAVRFWDYWLKDIDTGIMGEPKLRAYIHDPIPPLADYEFMPGRFVGEKTWPSNRIMEKNFYLNKDGLAKQPIHQSSPLTINSAEYVGENAGRLCPGMRLGLEHATDQSEDDERSLCFDSAPLNESFEILGTPSVSFCFSSDQSDAIVAIRLCDVDTQGRSFRVSYGLKNLNHRKNNEHYEKLTIGKNYQVNINLNDIGYRFAYGHKIRIAISTSYWPITWPSPQPATLKIAPGVSRLILPIRDSNDDSLSLKNSEYAISSDLSHILKQPHYVRKNKLNAETQELILKTIDDMGIKTIKSSGITMASKVSENYRIIKNDPLSSELTIKWSCHHYREGKFASKIIIKHRQTLDKDNYYLSARIKVFQSGELFFKKKWHSQIARR